MANERYTVRVTKDYLVFSAGHFITFAGDHCERIHGHNYRATVEVEDVLDENHYVFDFLALRDLTRGITDELDHRMLLPSRSALIRDVCRIHNSAGREFGIGLGFYSGMRFHLDSKGYRRWGANGSGATSPCVTGNYA